MPQDRPPPPIDSTLCLSVDSDPLAVRAALQQLIAGLAARGVPTQALGAVELVLAEVLNNVVEHAYAQSTGPIEIMLRPTGNLLECLVCDRGRSMPADAVPPGTQSPLDGPVADLPEGGFGWFLIRKLAEGIDYRRTGGQNQLSFRMRIDAAAPVAPARPAQNRL